MMRLGTAAVVAAVGVVCGFAAPALADDGGSGTYTASGTAYAFDLLNSGTTAWQHLHLVGPAGTVFVGGASEGEITISCRKGQPNGLPVEMECGPLSGSGLAPGARLALIATLAASVPCGSTFELDVSSNGAAQFTRVADLTQAGSCTSAPPPCTPAELAVNSARSALAVVETRTSAYSRAWSTASKALRTTDRRAAADDVQRLRHATLLEEPGMTKIRAALAATATALHSGALAHARSLFAGTGSSAAAIQTLRRSASDALAHAKAAREACQRS
jgi:hypothetical protein